MVTLPPCSGSFIAASSTPNPTPLFEQTSTPVVSQRQQIENHFKKERGYCQILSFGIDFSPDTQTYSSIKIKEALQNVLATLQKVHEAGTADLQKLQQTFSVLFDPVQQRPDILFCIANAFNASIGSMLNKGNFASADERYMSNIIVYSNRLGYGGADFEEGLAALCNDYLLFPDTWSESGAISKREKVLIKILQAGHLQERLLDSAPDALHEQINHLFATTKSGIGIFNFFALLTTQATAEQTAEEKKETAANALAELGCRPVCYGLTAKIPPKNDALAKSIINATPDALLYVQDAYNVCRNNPDQFKTAIAHYFGLAENSLSVAGMHACLNDALADILDNKGFPTVEERYFANTIIFEEPPGMKKAATQAEHGGYLLFPEAPENWKKNGNYRNYTQLRPPIGVLEQMAHASGLSKNILRYLPDSRREEFNDFLSAKNFLVFNFFRTLAGQTTFDHSFSAKRDAYVWRRRREEPIAWLFGSKPLSKVPSNMKRRFPPLAKNLQPIE